MGSAKRIEPILTVSQDLTKKVDVEAWDDLFIPIYVLSKSILNEGRASGGADQTMPGRIPHFDYRDPANICYHYIFLFEAS